MSANLRRALHNDLTQESFRANLEKYLNSFHQLVKEQWGSFKELQSLTTGHNLDIMFADLTADTEMILSADPEPSQQDASVCKEHLCHLMSVASKASYYAVPAKEQHIVGSTTYIVFQLLGFKPWNRKYIQRLTQWSFDCWKGNLSCAVLGSLVVKNTNEKDGSSDKMHIQSLAMDTEFKSFASCVKPLPLEDFFVNDNIDFLHQFTQVAHTTEFDSASILALLEDSDQAEKNTVDDDFVTLVCKEFIKPITYTYINFL